MWTVDFWNEFRRKLITQKLPVNPDMRVRAQQNFGWIEFGYIACRMWCWANPWAKDVGLGLADEIASDLNINTDSGAYSAFKRGWEIYAKEFVGIQAQLRKEILDYHEHGVLPVEEQEREGLHSQEV